MLLVGTRKSLLWVNPWEGISKVIARGHGPYYGISFDDKHVWVAARGGASKSPHIQMWSYGKMDHPVGTLRAPFPMADMHQILRYRDRLWITCSGQNMIASYSPKVGRWNRWYPRKAVDIDVNHINSLYAKEDSLWLMAHNGPPGTVVHPTRQSEIWEYRLGSTTPTLVKEMRAGFRSHNIWHRDNIIHYCDSCGGRVRSLAGLEVRTGGFPRGVVDTGENVFAGVTPHLYDREARGKATPRIVIFDSTWSIVHSMPLPEEGAILELRAPGMVDAASPHRGRKISIPPAM